MFKSLFKYFRRSKTENVQAESEPYCEYTTIKSILVGGVRLHRDMRVICRSNEPDPLTIGTIDFFYCPKHWYDGGRGEDSAIPYIRCESTGKLFGILGIIKTYSEELLKKLETMPPIEQWNYLAYSCNQIEEKYGVKYKTYNHNEGLGRPKYKAGNTVDMVINGFNYGKHKIESVSHFDKEWWYNIEGKANPSEESILHKIT
jgi:hypothetical protein